MSTTQFVEMYHPLIPSTELTPARVALRSVDEWAAKGWLLVDPDGVLPTPSTPYYTKEALLSQIQGGAAPIGTALRAAFVPFWTAAEAVTTSTVRVAPDGSTIKSNSARTTRGTYDATEQAAWTVVSSGGSVPDASTTAKGIVELATTAETTTGTDAVRAVTPAGVKAVTDALPTVARTGVYADLTGKPTIPAGPTIVDHGTYVTMTVA